MGKGGPGASGNIMETLREQWLWNGDARLIFVSVLLFVGLVATAALFPSEGLAAFAIGLLPCAGSAAIVGLIYGYVGKRVRALQESLAGELGERSEALAQIGKLQSPAIAILTDNELVLVPLVGERLTVPFAEMRSVREGRHLYGKSFVWKRAFLIEAPQNARIGFAVAPSVAGRWRHRLMRRGCGHV